MECLFIRKEFPNNFINSSNCIVRFKNSSIPGDLFAQIVAIKMILNHNVFFFLSLLIKFKGWKIKFKKIGII